MKIIPLSEGTFTIDKTKIFVPFDTEEDVLNARPIGSLLVEVQPFLVITQKDIILIDAGLGFYKQGKLQLHQSLAEHGINPEDITKVLLSHLHKDHAGGVAIKDKYGTYSPAFPNALYYVQEREYRYALETGFPSYMTEEISILEDNLNTVWLTEDEGWIDEYIRYEITGGHSVFHQVFWIEEGDEILFFGGDDAPQLQQMKSKFVAKYDFDGRKCMELRNKWWVEGAGNWTFLFYHDIKTPFYVAV